MSVMCLCLFLFFFNDTATTEIYTLSLHDALPISAFRKAMAAPAELPEFKGNVVAIQTAPFWDEKLGAIDAKRSEEHTSELQSRQYLVCRLLLEKKKNHALIRAWLLHPATPL